MSAFRLPEALTHVQVVSVMNEARAHFAALPADAAWVVEAQDVARLDSSAVALLLEIQRWAKAASRSWRVLNPPTQLSALIQVYGLDEVLALPVA